ncbi:hypothetical protein [Nonomuraea sp. B1E8]|uniref:hypothetical protein n=1 Tax=unclassified Nonomuraea TaxID=2593643 RepID=UPI00325D61DF
MLRPGSWTKPAGGPEGPVAGPGSSSRRVLKLIRQRLQADVMLDGMLGADGRRAG